MDNIKKKKNICAECEDYCILQIGKHRGKGCYRFETEHKPKDYACSFFKPKKNNNNG